VAICRGSPQIEILFKKKQAVTFRMRKRRFSLPFSWRIFLQKGLFEAYRSDFLIVTEM
jgi:hypothetical protein